jgi:D-serine deaminase-like pyridoxal phosphate-dependent protein
VLGPEYKSLPPSAWGQTAETFLATRPKLSDFQTPVLAIDRSALDHNVRVMGDWLRDRGLEIAPHGKTTMAPQLWQHAIDGGAAGITLATTWQVQVARAHGFSNILLANEVTDPVALRWIEAELTDPSFEFSCWVDSVASVRAMEAALGKAVARPIAVLVELGAAGGRAGVRSVEAALEVAAAVEASPVLSLVGVAGWEGSLAGDRSDAAIGTLTDFLDNLVRLHDSVHWGERVPVVTAGGSAFFEIVAARLAPLVGRARVLLRSGAFQIHDDAHYLGLSPFANTEREFRSAMHGWARVMSRPEPGLALLDGGKRDLPFDLDLPTPQLVAGMDAAESANVLNGSSIRKLNDQHAFLALSEDSDLPLGSVVRLGLSHPCTAFDKWRLLPLVDNADDFDAPVVDLIRTWF